VSDILKEIEDSWGVQRELWSLEQWKNAAILSANSYDKLAKLTDDVSITTQEASFHADTLITLLKERLEKSEADNTKLIRLIMNKFIKKPRHKPLRTLRDLWPPKRGQPPKYSHQQKVELIAIADGLKNDPKITTDIDAMRHFCRDSPARIRRTETEKLAKLLSRFRKEIAN